MPAEERCSENRGKKRKTGDAQDDGVERLDTRRSFDPGCSGIERRVTRAAPVDEQPTRKSTDRRHRENPTDPRHGLVETRSDAGEALGRRRERGGSDRRDDGGQADREEADARDAPRPRVRASRDAEQESIDSPIVAAPIACSKACWRFTGLSSISRSMPISRQRVILSYEQCSSSCSSPIASSHNAVAAWAPDARWLVMWMKWPAPCQALTASTAPG